MRMTVMAGLTAALSVVGASGANATASAPVIKSVVFTSVAKSHGVYSYVATITGLGFGDAPVGVPCTACTPNELQVVDLGGSKLPQPITVTAWSPKSITISGVMASPKAALIVDVYNDATGQAGAIGVSTTRFAGPKITGVTAAGTGQNLQITVNGSGFGAAPSEVGQNTNSPYMLVTDFNNGSTGTGGFAWHAGFCGSQQCDGVTMGYQSWSDTQIVMSGYGSVYGAENWSVNSGDAFCVAVWPTTGDGLGATGASTWCGRLP